MLDVPRAVLGEVALDGVRLAHRVFYIGGEPGQDVADLGAIVATEPEGGDEVEVQVWQVGAEHCTEFGGRFAGPDGGEDFEDFAVEVVGAEP